VEPIVAKIVRFGVFELEVDSGELRRQGVRVRLSDQPLQILKVLLGRSGQIVTREELRAALWPADTFVDFDAGLNSAMRRLRDALRDPAENPQFIETIPRRGYRFIGVIEPPATRSPIVEPSAGADRPHQSRRRVPPLIAAGVVVACVSVLSLAWIVGYPTDGGGVTRRIDSIAVLPFENLTGDKQQQYLADGMTETLTTSLAQLKALRVVSRNSAMYYGDSKEPLAQIARALKVDGVVQGAVVQSGNRVRVTARLVEARSDHHVWADTYDRDVRDLASLQADAAEAIASAIQIAVSPDERLRLTRSRQIRPDAFDEYLKGRSLLAGRGPANVLKAAYHLERAVALQPDYALALSGLSDAYRLFDVNALGRPREVMPKAEAAARRALALDDTLAEAHVSLAGVLFRYHWRWSDAEREYTRALELDPRYAEGHRARASLLLMLRRHSDAVASARSASRFSPASPVISIELALALAHAGHHREALEELQRVDTPARDSPRLPVTLALTHLAAGDPARALGAMDRGASPPGGRSAWYGFLCALQGRRTEAKQVLQHLERRVESGELSPQHPAIVYLGLGDQTRALELLERAAEQRWIEVMGFSGPIAESLLDNARFRALLQRMGLADEPGYSAR
jgi:TolB-like protein/DNA-binding winged helix-turn-helix (wHTH) protein